MDPKSWTGGGAEGTRFELATGCPALHFQSDATTPVSAEKQASSPDVAANGQRAGGNLVDSDPDLALLAEFWGTLPEALKAGIVAMVRAAGEI